ncbi:MAG: TetR/AcrR family transcriptional regulator [Candidatus Riflemargulisbacteria bacterium]
MNTKEIIIEAAKKRFLDRGFNGTSMRDITNASGISQGGIYSCFSSKEDLFKEVLNHSLPFDDFIKVSETIIKEETDPEIFFQKLAATFLHSFKTDNMKLRMIDFLEFKGKYFQLLFQERVQANPNILTEKIQTFISSGQMKEMSPHTLLLSFLMSVFSYLFITSYILGKQPIASEFIESINIFLHGALL